MNKTYNMQEILTYIYNEIILNDNPKSYATIQKGKKYIAEHQDEVEAGKEIIKREKTEVDSLNITDSEKEYYEFNYNRYYDPNQIYDLVPLATFLNKIDFNSMYVKNSDGNIKNVFTGDQISISEIYEKKENTLIITPSVNSDYPNSYRFTIIGDLKAISIYMNITPTKDIENNYYAGCATSSFIFASLDNGCIYIDDTKPREYQIDHFVTTREVKNIKQRLVDFLLGLNGSESQLALRFIDSLKQYYPYLNYENYTCADNSKKQTNRELEFYQPSQSMAITSYFNMLYKSEHVSELYEKLQNVPFSKASGTRLYNLTKFKEIIDKNRLTYDELNYIYSLKPNKIMTFDDVQDMNDNYQNDGKTKQDANELNQVYIESPKQVAIEKTMSTSEKLQSDKFKEFQSNKSKRLQKQNELREKIAAENVIKEEWQNSPEHPNNIRKDELNQIAKTIETLEQLRSLNPMLVSDEQLELITKYKEFLDMYNRETKREHEIDTGMSEESRSWYQNHYSRR